VGFTLDLCTHVNHADQGENAMEYFDDLIANAIAEFRFVIDFASQKVVTVRADSCAAFAFVVKGVFDDWKPKFALQCHLKGLIFNPVRFIDAAHHHKCH
jgi:hypothetical protein